MAEPAAWMLEDETETDRLKVALAEARAELQRRDAALQKLQGELMTSRLEVAGARGETVQFQGLLRRAEEATAAQASAELQAAAMNRDAEIAQLHVVIATLQAETAALRAGIDLLRASASWRISAPVRFAGRLIRSIRNGGLGLFRAAPPAPLPPAAPPPEPVAALPSPGDATASAIFQPTLPTNQASGDATGVVTLDVLYRLSRSL